MLVGLTLNVNGFVENLGPCPCAFYTILIRGGRVERLDVKILNVGAVIGEAPGDVVVVADDDHRRAGKRESLNVPARRREVNLVPDGRDHQLKVRVIGKQRLAGGRVCATHDPIVAAKALANIIF